MKKAPVTFWIRDGPAKPERCSGVKRLALRVSCPSQQQNIVA